MLPYGVVAVAVYDGYWAVGAGVMFLALLLLAVDPHLARANALKNMLLDVADVTCAVGFVHFGPVDGTAAAPMALGLLVGSTMGLPITRRVPSNLLRVAVALAGRGLALHLWVSPS